MKIFFLWFAFLVLISPICTAQQFHTIANGDWHNPLVWDQHLIPAHGDSIFIHHYISVEKDLYLNQVYLEMTGCGGINTPYNLMVSNAELYTRGNILAGMISLDNCKGKLGDKIRAFGIISTNSQLQTSTYKAGNNPLTACKPGIKLFHSRQGIPPVLVNHCSIEGITHRWYRNDTLLEGENSAMLRVNTPGAYKCQVEYDGQNTSGFSNVISIFEEEFTGEEGFTMNFNEQPVIYPNPFKDKVYLNSFAHHNRVTALEITSPAGELINIIDIDQDEMVNLKFLADGLYFIRPLFDNGAMGRKIKMLKIPDRSAL